MQNVHFAIPWSEFDCWIIIWNNNYTFIPERERERESFSILHFAPEQALFNKLTKLNYKYIDGDIHPAYARHIVDITDIPFGDETFDLILCSHVLGHVPDEKKAISELYRTLKQTGTALVMTLINLESAATFEDSSIQSPEDRLKNYGEDNLCRLHGKDFKERLAACGFNVEVIDYRQAFSKEEQRKFSLGDGKRELIYKCTKTEFAKKP